MKLKFLKPQISNVAITILILSLPLIRERAPIATGGYEEVFYRPIFLLTAYLQMEEFYGLLLMSGFSLFVYLVVSILLALFFRLFKKLRN
jgi:hypothetical protein